MERLSETIAHIDSNTKEMKDWVDRQGGATAIIKASDTIGLSQHPTNNYVLERRIVRRARYENR